MCAYGAGKGPAPRPRVVLTTTASVDGRVTLTGSERLLDQNVAARWRAAWPDDVEGLIDQRRSWIEAHYAPTVVLEGSGTFVPGDATSPWSEGSYAGSGGDDGLYVDHLPHRTPHWFAVVDGRGRIDWSFTGDNEMSLLVLACRTTPTGYLRHLRALGICYLVVGDGHVDLGEALERMYAVLGAVAVIADGGGGINGALVRAGLVDEVHVITFPALVGGQTTPSFVDGAPLPPGSSPVSLRPMSLVQGAGGSIWARYEVHRS
ncbi:MAG: dihydrofolate reductase family protein [Candidatus Nanopelagicales bacterium]